MSEPRAYTAEEARTIFLDHIRGMAHYWATRPGRTPQERCGGLAFSILAAIDGSSICLPSITLSLSPHPDGKEFCRSEGENWFEDGMVINDCDLHEMYYKEEGLR